MKKIVASILLLSSQNVFAEPITINVTQFVDEVYTAQKHPNFIQGYETGDKSQFILFRAKELDSTGVKVVIEKAINASYGSFPRYSITKTELSCEDQSLKRTFFFFDEFGNLGHFQEQEPTVLAMDTDLGKLACGIEEQ